METRQHISMHNNFPITGPKEMQFYELPDKEFKIISKLQENTMKSGKQYRTKWEVQQRCKIHKKRRNRNSRAEE